MTQATALQRLETEASSAATYEDLAVAWARLGIGLAQAGKLEESKQAALKLRSLSRENGDHPLLAIGALTVDGVIAYYVDRNKSSLDRLKRSFALASAINSEALRGQSATWLSHVAYNFNDVESFRLGLVAGVSCLRSMHDVERNRLCLVVADAIQLCGDWLEAAEWYGLARKISRRNRDHALLVAIEYNRLAMGLSRLRLDKIVWRVGDTSMQRAWLLELGTVKNLHSGFSIEALMPLITHCQAWQSEADGKFSEAAGFIRALIDKGESDVVGFSEALLSIEAAWCHLMSRDAPILPAEVPSISDVLSLIPDERLVALYYLDQLGESCFNSQDWAIVQECLASERLRCSSELKRLSGIIDGALPQPALIRTQIDQMQ